MTRRERRGTRGAQGAAARADRHALYQIAVQDPATDIDVIDRAFRRLFGRLPSLLREDFCGTALVACSWALAGPRRCAIGVDLDEEALLWGAAHNVLRLPPAARDRVRLACADVRDPGDGEADVVVWGNFSHGVFKTRASLIEVMRAAHAHLAPNGLLLIDVFGGSSTQREDRIETRFVAPGVRYVWEQRRFDPVTCEGLFAIHFRFADGTALDDAFTYDWRLWSLPEVRDAALESGFSRFEVHWEGRDERGRSTGRFARRTQTSAERSWMAYAVAVKSRAL